MDPSGNPSVTVAQGLVLHHVDEKDRHLSHALVEIPIPADALGTVGKELHVHLPERGLLDPVPVVGEADGLDQLVELFLGEADECSASAAASRHDGDGVASDCRDNRLSKFRELEVV